MFWLGIGVSAVAVVAGGLLGLIEADAEHDLRQAANRLAEEEQALQYELEHYARQHQAAYALSHDIELYDQLCQTVQAHWLHYDEQEQLLSMLHARLTQNLTAQYQLQAQPATAFGNPVQLIAQQLSALAADYDQTLAQLAKVEQERQTTLQALLVLREMIQVLQLRLE